MPNRKPQKRGHRVQTKTAQTAVSGSKQKPRKGPKGQNISGRVEGLLKKRTIPPPIIATAANFSAAKIGEAEQSMPQKKSQKRGHRVHKQIPPIQQFQTPNENPKKPRRVKRGDGILPNADRTPASGNEKERLSQHKHHHQSLRPQPILAQRRLAKRSNLSLTKNHKNEGTESTSKFQNQLKVKDRKNKRP